MKRVIVKKEAKTDAKFGKLPSERTVKELMQGAVVNINKPPGPTSHQVSAYAKDILGVKKAGHSGTLDPNVTGCLVVAFGNATRIVQGLLTAGKEYVCLMHVHDELPWQKVENAIKSFEGKIKQLPPIKSSVKRQWRYRKVYNIDIIEHNGKKVLFRTNVQAGTYIRKLVHDIGQRLNSGAHMYQLIRTRAGPFTLDNAVYLQDIADAMHYYKEGNEKYLAKILMPVENAVKHLPKVWVLDSTVGSLCHGSSLKVPGIAKFEVFNPEDTIAVMSLKNELVALGNPKMTVKEIEKADKGIAVKISKVFMEPGIYPKIEN